MRRRTVELDTCRKSSGRRCEANIAAADLDNSQVRGSRRGQPDAIVRGRADGVRSGLQPLEANQRKPAIRSREALLAVCTPGEQPGLPLGCGIGEEQGCDSKDNDRDESRIFMLPLNFRCRRRLRDGASAASDNRGREERRRSGGKPSRDESNRIGRMGQDGFSLYLRSRFQRGGQDVGPYRLAQCCVSAVVKLLLKGGQRGNDSRTIRLRVYDLIQRLQP